MQRTRGPSWNFSKIVCPKCKSPLLYTKSSVDSLNSTCVSCQESVGIIKCIEFRCQFQKKICMSCDLDNSGQLKINNEIQAKGYKTRNVISAVIVLLSFCFAIWSLKSSTESRKDPNVVALIKKLRGDYPSQENETWSHVLSVLEKEIPSVKSITLLHGEDKTTANCLVSELVFLYTGDSSIKMEEITFSTVGSEVKDYGFILEHYHAIVEKFRVLVTDLTGVSGNTARIFHSLCDEESSDIKPSLFIFTLKYNNKTKNLRTMTTAGNILREAWSNLPESELSPLLSRVIKNVVNITVERQARC